MSARDEVAAVLAEHGVRAVHSTPALEILRYHCRCGVTFEGDLSEMERHVADALLASPALARVIRERESACGCTPGTEENGWHENRCSACAAQDRQQWEDAMEKSEVLGDLIRKGRSDLQARLDAIAAYAGHPGNWGTSDHRGRLIHDLATGAIDPTSRDWGDTSLPAKEQP